MNAKSNPANSLCTALRRVGLARTGAALAVALGATQVGATTYTVPLQFNLTLTAPVCSLTVGTVTADATTPTPATGVTVNLTPTPLAVIASPNTIVGAIPAFTTITVGAPGIALPGVTVAKRMDSPPSASATCTVGTPMTARISRGVSAATVTLAGTVLMAGSPGSGQSGTLPIGMLMGIASFGGVAGTSGGGGTTAGTTEPTVSATATGSAQALNLTTAVYANSTTLLTASQAGLWTYSYNVNLDF